MFSLKSMIATFLKEHYSIFLCTLQSPQTTEEVKESAPNGDPHASLTQSMSMSIKQSPPSPNGGAASSPTAEPSSPSNMKRASTIDRRLPELPPMHSKVPGIPENEENDYNGTYDTIKDDKKKNAGSARGSRKLPSTTEDDPAYNSVEDTMGTASVTRKDGGVVVGAIGAGGALEEDCGDYASVKGKIFMKLSFIALWGRDG